MVLNACAFWLWWG